MSRDIGIQGYEPGGGFQPARLGISPRSIMLAYDLYRLQRAAP